MAPAAAAAALTAAVPAAAPAAVPAAAACRRWLCRPPVGELEIQIEEFCQYTWGLWSAWEGRENHERGGTGGKGRGVSRVLSPFRCGGEAQGGEYRGERGGRWKRRGR